MGDTVVLPEPRPPEQFFTTRLQARFCCVGRGRRRRPARAAPARRVFVQHACRRSLAAQDAGDIVVLPELRPPEVEAALELVKRAAQQRMPHSTCEARAGSRRIRVSHGRAAASQNTPLQRHTVHVAGALYSTAVRLSSGAACTWYPCYMVHQVTSQCQSRKTPSRHGHAASERADHASLSDVES